MKKPSDKKVLDLSSQKLTEIPAYIGFLEKLEELDLSNNQIEDISYVLKDLSQLRCLNLSNNKIKELPEWILELPNLKILHIDNNAMTLSADIIDKLSKLETFTYSGNDIEDDDFWGETLVKVKKKKRYRQPNRKVPVSVYMLKKKKPIVSYERGNNKWFFSNATVSYGEAVGRILANTETSPITGEEIMEDIYHIVIGESDAISLQSQLEEFFEQLYVPSDKEIEKIEKEQLKALEGEPLDINEINYEDLKAFETFEEIEKKDFPKIIENIEFKTEEDEFDIYEHLGIEKQ